MRRLATFTRTILDLLLVVPIVILIAAAFVGHVLVRAARQGWEWGGDF